MTQDERRLCLIKYLLKERAGEEISAIPADELSQKRLLRSLMNIRPAEPVSQEFIRMQDAYLQEEMKEKGIIRLSQLSPARKGFRLWQGDITRLAVDAIVNAANSALLGCFIPCHGCIDNAIHSAAGVQLRLECARLMNQQGTPEPTGQAKITKAYNLPCRYVLHTVGPIVRGAVTEEDRRLLSGCYLSCLELAESYGLKSVSILLHLYGRISFPQRRSCQDCNSDGRGLSERTSEQSGGDIQCFQRQ